MYPTVSLIQKITLYRSILWPILITQISYHAMNVIDTMMSGRAGTTDLAGVAVGASLWAPILTGFNGILMAVTPIVAQLLGKGEKQTISRTIIQALYLSLILALIVYLAGMLFLPSILAFMGLETEVSHIAKHYLIGLSIGLIPLFASNVLRFFFDAQGFTRITMVILLITLPISALLNYLLIFGKFGFPELGGIGAGYATGFTYWIIFGLSVFMTFKIPSIRSYALFSNWFRPSLKAWKAQLSLGLPMGLSIFFEASIFSFVTLLVGRMFTTDIIAAHQAALNFASLLFMIPLSMSMALTIVVAYEIGSGRLKDARQYSRIGITASMLIITLASVLLYFFREPISYLYTDNEDVVALAMTFFIFAIFYQLSDAAQATLQGVLRGYKDATIPFIIALVSYWGIGIPSGYLLATLTDLGPYGFWIGIIIGLTCAAIGFWIRLAYINKRIQLP
ncbi:MATE family efflux transporter [Alkalicoccobacillus murimartini]|uniref:Probable multidrug resistance protein NorM n=1 Tax=Alkalicoccobacillus murimartini TaxID=171685 RepID=A0ABT9YG84_9BACI|nr:MATE family efflux transporter [Alkalicoccobacillus murimartini]MDQ0206521.1 MATE family multidrug resistance protein [Alkalicoccobacillus murimartini]